MIEPNHYSLIRLGDKVRDRISGLEGRAVTRVIHLHGCDQIVIEPPATDGKIGELIVFHVERLELIESFPDFHINEDISDSHIKLGNKVRDMLTGLEGIACTWSIPLYGVARVSIEPGLKIKGKVTENTIAEGFYVDEPRVEVIEPKEPPVAKEATSPRAKTTGAAPTSTRRSLTLR